MKPNLYARWRDLLIEIEEKAPGLTARNVVIIDHVSRMLQMYEVTQERLSQIAKEL